MQKNLVKISFLALAVALMAGCISRNALPSQKGKISVKALIDGRDVVYIKGNTIWMQHEAYDLPGKWAGQDLPIRLNEKQDWTLVWNGNLAQVVEMEDNPGIPTAGTWNKDNFKVELTTVGYGGTRILKYPSAENDYTLSFEFNDIEPNGAHWYSADIDWDEDDDPNANK
jgi:hypothetical protein